MTNNSVSAGQLTARVHSIETGGASDGPGIRYILFLQGCNFKCIYCHNRDTWDMNGGKIMTVDEIMKEVVTYSSFFNVSGGGITCSGGEASLQPKFVAELFHRVHEAGFTTCLDTNGSLRRTPDYMRMIDETDTFLLDLKCMHPDKHREITGWKLEPILDFGRFLHEKNKKIWIRMVIIPGWTDDDENIILAGKYIQTLGDSVDRVELLPYHELGKHKWKDFGETYKLEDVRPPSAESMEHLIRLMRNYFKETY